jgi:hypothetical protein
MLDAAGFVSGRAHFPSQALLKLICTRAPNPLRHSAPAVTCPTGSTAEAALGFSSVLAVVFVPPAGHARGKRQRFRYLLRRPRAGKLRFQTAFFRFNEDFNRHNRSLDRLSRKGKGASSCGRRVFDELGGLDKIRYMSLCRSSLRHPWLRCSWRVRAPEWWNWQTQGT